MNTNIVDIEDWMPSVVIKTNSGASVVPVLLIQKWIKGEKMPSKEEMQTIVREWFESLQHEIA